jgi:hypothetical protein
VSETYANIHRVGRFLYRKRPYTPKRRGETAGHGWVRDDPRAEVGAEVRVLLDEIDRLRGMLVRADRGTIIRHLPGCVIEHPDNHFCKDASGHNIQEEDRRV